MTADLLASLSEAAQGFLAADPPSQADLNALSSQMPDRPSWMDPRHTGFDPDRDAWQIEAADLFRQCSTLALDLRVVRRRRWWNRAS